MAVVDLARRRAMVFGRKRRPQFDAGAFDSIVAGLKAIYREKVRPIEEQFLVKDFHYPLLTDDDFDAKPQVLLIGSLFAEPRLGCRK